ncbi:MAG: hypothetical protein M1358_18790, partial [Chloroflexi bacterium]|nr:hypothetical protein [Chloroflexota bacterium]
MARLLAIILVALLLLPSMPALGASEDWDVPNGHFFTQTGGGSGNGYAVTDPDGAKFWSEVKR